MLADLANPFMVAWTQVLPEGDAALGLRRAGFLCEMGLTDGEAQPEGEVDPGGGRGA